MRTNRIRRAATRPLRRLGDTRLAEAARARQVGQVLPIFAVMSVVLLGGAALLTDVAWWWTNELRMQRAADAASLAGAVYLPADQNRAYAAAWAEAAKNGYPNAGNVVVTPRRDPDNLRKLIVDIEAPVQTNFARVFCWQGGPCLQQVDIGVTGAAEFVLPVPMGSPENYYGVFGNVRGMTSTRVVTTTTNHSDRGWSCGSGDSTTPLPAPPGNPWQPGSGCTGPDPNVQEGGAWTTGNGSLNDNDNNFAQVTVTDLQPQRQHQWSTFGAQTGIPNPGAGESVDIVGLQVRLTDAHRTTNCTGGNANIDVQLSWDAGATWTAPLTTGNLGTDPSNGDFVLGSDASISWQPASGPAHTWTRADFADGPARNFRVRLTANENCTQASVDFRVDQVDVRVTSIYNYSTTTTTTNTTNLGDVPLEGPGTLCNNGKLGPTGQQECYEADNNVVLNPRGFWATLNTQGAENVNGDAHQPGYDERTNRVALNCPSGTMACYDGNTYYNYAIEMAPGSTGGRVYIFDPQFCDVANNRGTGDRWFGGNAGVTTIYELWDTGVNRADPGDDTRLAYSDARFRGLAADDSTMGGSGGAECMYRTDTLYGDGRDYHNRWYLLYDGMSGGTNGHVYRVHTTSTDQAPGAGTQQLGTNGENSFAIYASASGVAPKVYGLGAMQAFTPLRADNVTESVSEFYLAQIEAAHKGKTIEIRLWDPGDTNPLTANLQILRPEGSGWTEADFSYSASPGTTHGSVANCASQTNGTSLTNIVQTNVGNTAGTFNGCWLVLRSVIPDTYDADQDGWWRIRYRMRNSQTGIGTSNDVTTWTVNLIGNPVHLVMP